MNFKKNVSILLCMIMLFSIISFPSFAEESIPKEEVVVTDGEYLGDISVEDKAEITENEILSVDVAAVDEQESENKNVVSEEQDLTLTNNHSDTSTNNDELMLMAIEPDTTYTVIAGLTKSFENLGTVELTVKTNNRYMDYVVYYKDNSVKEYFRDTHKSEITVPAGGRLVLTARTNDVDCTIADDYFMVDDQENTVFNTKIIKDRKTYSFTNNSLIPIKLLSTGHYRDYVIYGADGTVSEQKRDTYFNNKEIPAGSTIKITSRHDELEICPLYEYFDVVENSEQVFKKVLISTGETYSFVNTSDSPYDILSNSTNRDYILYDGAGKVTEYNRDTYWGSSCKKEIPSGSKIKITARYSNLEICALSEFFNVKKEDTQVFKKILIPAGETYSFANTGDSPYNLLSNSTDRDYIIYDGSGNITEYGRDTYWGSSCKKEIASGNTIKITARYSNLEICAINEFFNVSKQEKNVFKKVVIPAGETYTFTNKSDNSYELLSNSTDRDYVIYDTDGTVVEYVRDTYWGSSCKKEIPSGYTIKITARYSNLEICAINEIFEIEKISVPVFEKIVIMAGDTYTFTNTSNNSFELLSNSTDRDYVIYDTNGNATEYARNTYWGSSCRKEIPSGYTIKITSRYSNLEICALNDCFDVEKITDAVFETVVIPAGEQYKFTNLSSDSLKILSAGYNGDYVIYNSSGNATSSKTNANINNLGIASGYSVMVAAKDGWIECCVLSDAFTVSYINSAGLYTELSKGKTYEISNVDAADYNLYWDNSACVYDYIVYGAEGTIVEHNVAVWCKEIVIPSGGKAILTAKTNFLIKNDDKISISEYETPVYKSTDISDRETFYFDNTTLLELDLRLSAGYYDYIIYNKNGTINTYKTDQYLENLTVPSESKVAITGRDECKTVFAIYDIFNISNDVNRSFLRKELQTGQTLKLKNTSTKDYNVLIKGNQYDYVIFNADASIKKYEHDVWNQEQTIATNGYIIITARQPIIVEGLKESFEMTDLDIAVYNYDSIYSGQTLLVKNTSVKDYKALVATDCYDYVTYDATDKISESSMEVYTQEQEFSSGVSKAITAINGSCTVITLNDIFKVNSRSYPALMRKTVYENEKYVFTNAYSEKCILQNSNAKLNYAIYTETDSVVEADNETYKNSMEIPAGGKVEVDIKSSNVMFAGPYEAFSGEDLTVKATGVTLSANSLNIVKGKQALLKATVMPEDATNKTVSWSSSDTSVVTVAQTGKVTAKAVGTAIITVTTEDGSYTANCEVNVTDGTSATVSVTGVALNKTTTSMTVGGTETLTATVSPSNATNKNVTWSSSNTSVATVSNGVITAKATGTATITVTTADGSKTAKCVVTVNSNNVSVTGVSLNKTSVTLTVGGTETLTATVSPSNATNKDVTWSSSNTSVATVSNGVVTAKAAGTATITVTTADGSKKATCTVSVETPTLEKVSAPTANLASGNVTSGSSVELATSTSGATIYYTVDGTTPTTSSTKYTAAIAISGNITIKAIAVKSGMTNSDVTTFSYTVISTDAPTIKAGNKTGKAGKTVDVTVTLENNPGIAVLGFNIGYDSNAMTLQTVTVNDVFESAEITAGDISKNPYTVSAMNAVENNSKSGNLVTLTFLIKDDCAEGDYVVTITDSEAYNIDETEVKFNMINGVVTIKNVEPGDITGDGNVNRMDLLRLGKYFAGWTVDIDEAAADVTGDGKVNRMDLLRLGKFFAGWEVQLGQ